MKGLTAGTDECDMDSKATAQSLPSRGENVTHEAVPKSVPCHKNGIIIPHHILPAEKYGFRFGSFTQVMAYGLFVRDLPPNTLPSQLAKVFQTYGNIKYDRVRVKSKQNCCFGYIEFEYASGLENALKDSPINFDGYACSVEEASYHYWETYNEDNEPIPRTIVPGMTDKDKMKKVKYERKREEKEKAAAEDKERMATKDDEKIVTNAAGRSGLPRPSKHKESVGRMRQAD